jgi:hypothetical protein
MPVDNCAATRQKRPCPQITYFKGLSKTSTGSGSCSFCLPKRDINPLTANTFEVMGGLQLSVSRPLTEGVGAALAPPLPTWTIMAPVVWIDATEVRPIRRAVATGDGFGLLSQTREDLSIPFPEGWISPPHRPTELASFVRRADRSQERLLVLGHETTNIEMRVQLNRRHFVCQPRRKLEMTRLSAVLRTLKVRLLG